MENFKSFYFSIQSFSKITADEATFAMLDIPISERKERMKDICNIYDRYTFFLLNYRGLNNINLSDELQVFRFKSLIGNSFNTKDFQGDITKDIYINALSTAAINRGIIYSEFSKLTDWKPTPKAEIIPDWLPLTIRRLFAAPEPAVTPEPENITISPEVMNKFVEDHAKYQNREELKNILQEVEKILPDLKEKQQFATMALAIRGKGIIKGKFKFTTWVTDLCELFNKDKSTYKPNKLNREVDFFCVKYSFLKK